MQKILIVEDDRELNQGITYTLEKSGYMVMGAYSMQEAKILFRNKDTDVVLLDVNLPDGEGFELCKWIKERSQAAVLFLTARDLEEDALKGYELGAMDYIIKPFSMKILLKKIEVALKSEKQSDTHSEVKYNDGYLHIDFVKAKAIVNDEECFLTPTEFRLLKLFIDHGAQLLTYPVMLEHLWDSNGQFVDKHALAVNVNRLRGKIEDEKHQYISNVYGMGYQWLR